MPDTLADTMPTADLVKTIFIKADPETVWDYLTLKAHLAKWYNPAEADLTADAPYALTSKKTGKRVVWGRVLEWNQPSRLVTTFTVEPLEERETTVAWDLVAVAGGTRLTMTHSGIVPEHAEHLPLLGHLDEGWDVHLGMLRKAFAA